MCKTYVLTENDIKLYNKTIEIRLADKTNFSTGVVPLRVRSNLKWKEIKSFQN